ncbi:hypothetical protein OH687_12110 [Burkholderia anthina]|nr:hypothetical protein OH687_12110 [Burkholderia anthina]
MQWADFTGTAARAGFRLPAWASACVARCAATRDARITAAVRIKRVPAGGRSTKTFCVARLAIPVPVDGIPSDRIVDSIRNPN